LDATALVGCANHRIAQHRVFQGFAQRGKTSTGWCLGFKLHLRAIALFCLVPWK
jgi:Transposase DDE domain